jgi:NADPH:quinone reductase-like Zn-dependent oxidoreductase
MKAIRRSDRGELRSTFELIEVPDVRTVSPGSVLVEMAYSPLNRHDLYPSRAMTTSMSVPCIAGTEGVGRVILVGDGADESLLGKMVVAPSFGTWAERIAVRATGLTPLPDADPLQLSMLRINPSTASLLLSEFVALKPGDWIIQNAANSGVARSIIGFANARGIRTINLVRRQEVIEEITEIAGDSVYLDRDDGIERALEIAGGASISLALDAVGGEATARIARALSNGGALVSYAHMSRHDAPADLRPLLRKNVRLHTFCLADARYADKLPSLLAASAKLLTEKKIHTPVAAVYPASEIARATAHAIEGGKILLDLRPGRWT